MGHEKLVPVSLGTRNELVLSRLILSTLSSRSNRRRFYITNHGLTLCSLSFCVCLFAFGEKTLGRVALQPRSLDKERRV